MKSIHLILLSFFFYSLNIFYPQIGFFVNFFIPIILLSYIDNPHRNRATDAVGILLCTAIFIFSTNIGINLALSILFPTLFIYFRYKKGLNYLHPAVIAPVPVFIFTVLLLLLLPSYKTEIINMIVDTINKFSAGVKIDPSIDDKLMYVKNISKHSKEIAYVIINILPAVTFAYVSSIAHFTSRVYLRKKGLEERYFKVPEKMVILLIAGGFFILSKNINMKLISYNTLIIFSTLYFFQGFDIINHFIRKSRILYMFRLVLYVLLVTEPPLVIVVSLIGLFDTWFNFIKNKDTAAV